MTQITARHRLVEAAIEAFAEKGFHATTTRDIASRAGMSPAALYVHHDSKESLLFSLSREGHLRALEVIQDAASGQGDPVKRIYAMVYDFTKWHADHSRRGRIVQYELAGLAPEHLQEVAGYRREIEKTMRDALDDGVACGVFQIQDVPGTALAMLSLGIDLVRWFQPDGSRSSEDVAELYAQLALRMVGH